MVNFIRPFAIVLLFIVGFGLSPPGTVVVDLITAMTPSFEEVVPIEIQIDMATQELEELTAKTANFDDEIAAARALATRYEREASLVQAEVERIRGDLARIRTSSHDGDLTEAQLDQVARMADQILDQLQAEEAAKLQLQASIADTSANVDRLRVARRRFESEARSIQADLEQLRRDVRRQALEDKLVDASPATNPAPGLAEVQSRVERLKELVTFQDLRQAEASQSFATELLAPTPTEVFARLDAVLGQKPDAADATKADDAAAR